MMVRTPISLASELHAQARARVSECGISFAEYIRRLVARDLVESARSVDRSLVFDLGSAGGSDVSSEKDRMIADAMSAGKRRHSGQP